MDTKIVYLNTNENADKYVKKAAEILTMLTFGVKQGKTYKVTIVETGGEQ